MINPAVYTTESGISNMVPNVLRSTFFGAHQPLIPYPTSEIFKNAFTMQKETDMLKSETPAFKIIFIPKCPWRT